MYFLFLLTFAYLKRIKWKKNSDLCVNICHHRLEFDDFHCSAINSITHVYARMLLRVEMIRFLTHLHLSNHLTFFFSHFYVLKINLHVMFRFLSFYKAIVVTNWVYMRSKEKKRNKICIEIKGNPIWDGYRIGVFSNLFSRRKCILSTKYVRCTVTPPSLHVHSVHRWKTSF